MKIEEPKTPYEYASDYGDEEEEDLAKSAAAGGEAEGLRKDELDAKLLAARYSYASIWAVLIFVSHFFILQRGSLRNQEVSKEENESSYVNSLVHLFYRITSECSTSTSSAARRRLSEPSADEEDLRLLSPEEREKRNKFEQKRKKHYNEFYAVKVARQLMQEENEDEEDEEDSKGAEEDLSGRAEAMEVSPSKVSDEKREEVARLPQ